MRTTAGTAVPLVLAIVAVVLHADHAGIAAPRPPGGSDSFAIVTALPTLARGGEALAVDATGSTVAGHSWDRKDLLHAVRWTLTNGTWRLTDLPWPTDASSVIARALDHARDVAGNDFPGSRSRAVLWPAAGGVAVLGCGSDNGSASVYRMSARSQLVVGVFRSAEPGVAPTAAVWRPGGACREDLPPLAAGVEAMAMSANGDGSIVGGIASLVPGGPSFPVRWTAMGGAWQIEPLDARSGAVLAANAAGDLAGYVYIEPCTSADGCSRAAIWYAAGGSSVLGTLGGEDSWARGINAQREVVGISTSTLGTNTGFFWSTRGGMRQLPFTRQSAVANAVSDVRADGSRVVVGMSSASAPIVWVVKTP